MRELPRGGLAEDVRQSWRAAAACRGMVTDRFFPIGRGPAFERAADEVLQVCRGCVVREACLESAMQEGSLSDQWGVRGGLMEDERRTLMRSRRGAR